ncbi:MAG: phosphopantetheine-binding protein [Acidobacteria bacterium]|nr:phosphopantetheine-binding protein [Acidobacteriota bacterium]
MDKQATIQRLIEAVSKKKVTVAPDESLFDSGLLDSFALPDLVAALEQEYSIRIPDSDLNPRKFDTIERIEAYLDSLS